MGILEFVGLILGIIASLITIWQAIRTFVFKIPFGVAGGLVGGALGLWALGTFFFTALLSVPVTFILMIVDGGSPITLSQIVSVMVPVLIVVGIGMAVFLPIYIFRS